MGNVHIKVLHDDYPASPREWENIGVMVCWHDRYRLGDEQVREPQLCVDDLPAGTVVLPLWLYDHGGITMSAGSENPFSCEWDSGVVGIIYATPERIQREFGASWSRDVVIAVLKAEVKVYDDYLTGNCWSFVIEKDVPACECCGATAAPEIMDSCGGFYGDNALDDMRAHVDDEYHDLLEEAWERRGSDA
ncbi:MAG: hypothetical protein R3322_00420 [Kiloniellales bacterium]|nr:hypothetical protein [Kiloniellales bacterium]